MSSQENHKSAIEHPADVEIYLKEEVEHKAIYGPFEKKTNTRWTLFTIHDQTQTKFQHQESDHRSQLAP